MSTEQQDIPLSHDNEAGNRCPVDHEAFSRQKTARNVEPLGPRIECDEASVWHVRGFEEVRAILRSGDTKQAGFNAEQLDMLPLKMKRPILYLEGQAHHQQRKLSARYFAPKVVSTKYRQLMEKLVDHLMHKLQRKKRVDLSQFSLELAVRVAAEVVGLTSSSLPGMGARLDTFFDDDAASNKISAFIQFLRNRTAMLSFFFLDVRPAIKVRRQASQEDVISNLIAQGATDSEIFTECMTYAAAGMATTREFISAATWHFLEQPELRARYVAAPEEERHEILSEILRLEPIVGNLYRRATTDLHIKSNATEVVIPAGAKIDLHIHGANEDEAVVGEHAQELCPGRTLKGERVPTALMSFGDGHHRCPGSYIAIQETDMLLQRLLAIDTLRIERPPELGWNDMVTGYELRKFMIAIN